MASKYQRDEGQVGCEDEDKCFKCIPIKKGMQAIAILAALDATSMFLIAIDTKEYTWSFAGLVLGIVLYTMGALRQLMWLQQDT